MIKKYDLKLILVFFLVFSHFGCGFIDRYLHNDKYFEIYSREEGEQKRKIIEKHQECIGMSKEEIQKKYGKPEDVDYNFKHFTGEYDSVKKQWIYEVFEERWGYKFYTGIKYISGNLWWLYFYFKNDRVVKVDMD